MNITIIKRKIITFFLKPFAPVFHYLAESNWLSFKWTGIMYGINNKILNNDWE